MGAKTAISWSNSTWTPIRARVKPDAAAIAEQKGYGSLVQIAAKMAGRVGPHCEKTSPGCQNCYSETNNCRCLPHNGTGLPFDRRSRDLVDIHLDEKILLQPLRWKKGRRIFVCSQTDLFGEFVPDELIDRVFAVMALCPQHTFQVLTKRADRMAGYITARPDSMEIYRLAMLLSISTKRKGRIGESTKFPLPNVWLGVSIEDQRRADERIPHLLRTPAAVRFLSCEPLLEGLDLLYPESINPVRWCCGGTDCGCMGKPIEPPLLHDIDWVIVGGESGPGARPFNVRWARDLIRQCREAGAACFVKQLGSIPVVEPCSQHHFDFGEGIGRKAKFSAMDKLHPSTGLWRVHFMDRAGADPSEWPEDLKLQEFPGGRP